MAQKSVKGHMPKFRLSYPNFFTPKKNELSGKMEYGCQALYPPGFDFTELKKLCHKAAALKWGEDPKKWPENLRFPFRRNEDRAKKELDANGNPTGKLIFPAGMEPGGVFVTLKTINKPAVVGRNVEPIPEEEIYPGCYCTASIAAFPYEKLGNRGVSFGLNNVQKVAEGEPLGGRTRPEDDFQPIAGLENEDAGAMFDMGIGGSVV